MSKLKTITFKLSIIIFVFLIVLTVVSRTVYNLLLPVVDSRSVAAGILDYSLTFNGVFKKTTNATSVISADSWDITEIFVTNGQQVNKNDKLFKVDISKYQLQLYNLNTQIQEKTNNLNAVDWTGGDRLVKERDIEALKLEVAQIKKMFPANGIIVATSSGDIEFNPDIRAVAANSVVALIKNEGVMSLSVSINPEELAFVNQANSIDCVYKQALDITDIEKRTFPLKLTTSTYNEETKKYLLKFEAAENDIDVNDLTEGLSFEVKVKSKSDLQQALVPLSSIGSDASSNFVYVIQIRTSIWGVENYVQKRQVTVLQSNNEFAAIQEVDLNGRLVCTNPSKPLRDGDIVKVS